MPPPKTIAEAFSDKYVVELNTGCWIWVGASNGRYGLLWSPPRFIMAHRVAYQLHKGPIPKGMYVCHTCDVTFCVNPNHLFLGTQTDNMQDMISKGRKRITPLVGRHGNHAKGEANGCSKYTPEMIQSMRDMFMTCHNIAAIARHFNVSESHARRILRRQAWKHI